MTEIDNLEAFISENSEKYKNQIDKSEAESLLQNIQSIVGHAKVALKEYSSANAEKPKHEIN